MDRDILWRRMKSHTCLHSLSLSSCRWKLVQLGLDEQYKKLNEAKRAASSRSCGDESAPNPQDFLSVAVHYPWARAISQTKVPYYIK